jgi:hypothetical protein
MLLEDRNNCPATVFAFATYSNRAGFVLDPRYISEPQAGGRPGLQHTLSDSPGSVELWQGLNYQASWSMGNSKTVVDVAIVGVVPVAFVRSQVPRIVVPRTAPQHTLFAFIRPLGINN